MTVENVGIIGAGDMGSLTAGILDKAGYTVRAYDLPEKREELEKKFHNTGVRILDDGAEVARRSDMVIYAVETANLDKVVGEFGKSAKRHAIHGGLTSVKHPEMKAFEDNLPSHANRVTCHQLYGPTTGPDGQTVVIMDVRSNPAVYRDAAEVYRNLGTNVVELSASDHDKITADTQGITYVGFQSIGTAWKNKGVFPWEDSKHVGGIDNIKELMALRLYAEKPHVNSGITIFNPYIGRRIDQFDRSVNEIHWLMVDGEEQGLRDRIKKARDAIFANRDSGLLLDDSIMGEFSLRVPDALPNSNLMALAEVDTWHILSEENLKANPYRHLLCQTPNFRIRLGIAEYIFMDDDILSASIEEGLHNTTKLRSHDSAYVSAVKEWVITTRHGMKTGDPMLYHDRFKTVQEYLGDELVRKGREKSDDLIRRITKEIRNSNGANHTQ